MNSYKITTLWEDGELLERIIESYLDIVEIADRANRSGFNFASITVEYQS
jgi:hypothetical protein